MTTDLDRLAEQLAQHPDYRVLRRLQPREVFQAATPGQRVARGVVLDTETTGFDVENDRVIELGMLLFEFDAATGEVLRVLRTFDALEDPGFPIPPASTEIHHITDDMVRGQRINDADVAQVLDGVSVVVAHNAGFDRPFVEARWPLFADLHWACSLKDIDWRQEGFGSAKLDYLLYTQGLFHDAHRAEADCWALLEILSRTLPQSQQTGLLTLLEKLREPQQKIYAIGSPFETKDKLKARGYRWSADLRCWSRVVSGEAAYDAELAWLKHSVYADRQARVEVESLGGQVRYSAREGHKAVVTL